MQVIGLCRFSYPAIGGFQVQHDSLEERKAFLYDDTRLAARFRTFQAFTLPALQAQTDDDFMFLIVLGDCFPSPWRDRLEALVQQMPQAKIVARRPGPHRQVMQEVINAEREGKGPSLQFRMDDDDAVSVRYVELLRAAAGDLKQLMRSHRHIAIDFNRGYLARAGANGIAATETNTALTTAALALMVRNDVPQTIMNFAHHKLGQRMPVVTYPDDDMLVRGHTGLNDSRQKPGVKPMNLTPLDQLGEATFRRAFNIDANRVRDLFSADPGAPARDTA